MKSIFLTASFALLAVAVSVAAPLRIKSLSIEGDQVMTMGPNPDTPFANPYRLVAITESGDTLSDDRLSGISVVWDIDGFKTENDTDGQYCDSYGEFSVNGKPSLSTVFNLRNNPFNFVGDMTATVVDGKKRLTAHKYVTAIGMPATAAADAADNAVKVVLDAETGCVYKVTAAFSGVLNTAYVNEDLSGYELGRHERPDTAEYLVPCINGKIDLWATADNGAQPQISYVSIEKQDSAGARKKRKLHHIGDSTSANKGAWAHTLRMMMADGEYPELAALCDFCNDGAGGRQLRTYYIQGKLAKVLLDIRPDDIVMFGNNGTNHMNKTYEDDLNHYIDAAKAFGADVMLNSYTPHGAVSRWTSGYDPDTQRFDSYRRDLYDQLTRKIADQRAQNDPRYLGFVEIGKKADAIFNAYVDDFKANGHSSRDEAAQAIIRCFKDHNHYDADPLACRLMLDGYKDHKGIVTQIVEILGKQTK